MSSESGNDGTVRTRMILVDTKRTITTESNRDSLSLRHGQQGREGHTAVTVSLNDGTSQ
jgi:hypothetical protein